MSPCLVFEDGKLIHNFEGVLWDGLFSKAESNGSVVQYIQSCLPKNSIFIIPHSDGNMNRDTSITKYHRLNWDTHVQPFIDYAKGKNKVFMLGTLAQIDEEPNCNYVYIPLDDNIFSNGITGIFNKETLPPWNTRSSELCWRGGCSGVGEGNSLRVRFVEKIYNHDVNTNVRLSTWWSEGKNIPGQYFSNRIHYSEFTKYKIFFIVDGAVIASNHMYGFATGCVPIVISNGVCWFSHLTIPYTHYIPVNYDLSNLIEQIEWVKNNDDKAEIIAQNAYKFAEEYFSSEYQRKHLKDSIDKCCDNFVPSPLVEHEDEQTDSE
jgi:hypothetical protein